jgi:predicted nucleic acid-binding protein
MTELAPMLIDSDVLVWLTRGHVGAAQRLHAINPWRISAVTYIELAQGCRAKAGDCRGQPGPHDSLRQAGAPDAALKAARAAA